MRVGRAVRRNDMDRKRIVRSWWLWAAVPSVVFFVLPSLLTPAVASTTAVNTSQAIAQINSGNVDKAMHPRQGADLDLDLKTPVDGHDKISASYPADATPTHLQRPAPRQGADARRLQHQGHQEQRLAVACWSACCRSC